MGRGGNPSQRGHAAACGLLGGRAGGLGFVGAPWETDVSGAGGSALVDPLVRPCNSLFGGGSSEDRLFLSLETIDCNAALAGDVLSSSEECLSGSDVTCTACVVFDRGGNGGGPERAGRAGAWVEDVDGIVGAADDSGASWSRPSNPDSVSG